MAKKRKYPKNWWLKTSKHKAIDEIYGEDGKLKERLFSPTPQMISYAAGLARIRQNYKSNQTFHHALGLHDHTVRYWKKQYKYEDPQTGEDRNYFMEWLDATVDKFKAQNRPYLEYHMMKRIEEGSDVILKAAAEANGLIGKNLSEEKIAKKGVTASDIANMSKEEVEKYKRKYLEGRVGYQENEGGDDSSSGSESERLPDSPGDSLVEVQTGRMVFSDETSKDS